MQERRLYMTLTSYVHYVRAYTQKNQTSLRLEKAIIE